MAYSKRLKWPIAHPVSRLYAFRMAEPGTVLSSQAARDAFHGGVLPRQGDWSDEEYLRLTDNVNRLVEFADGYIQELPMPTRTHQLVLGSLYRRFHSWLAPLGGTVLFAPLRLRIRPGKFREPDLLVLGETSDIRSRDRYWLGADLVLEVVSPDDPNRDFVVKRNDYAEAGIPEYWIADPRNETITVLKLVAAPPLSNRRGDLPKQPAYAEQGIYARGQTAASVLFDGLDIDVASVFDASNTGQ
ncbi:MAG: Uma2 family endonuclease [Gammaproteobacteria bacterium]|nr:Uma2 family endonuclease [Gammaproteobacteria bacterium]